MESSAQNSKGRNEKKPKKNQISKNEIYEDNITTGIYWHRFLTILAFK